jgi:nicotinamide mononucleotide (NMN) deamidase PncC
MKLFEAKNATVTLAEVGSGGVLAAALNGAEGEHHALVGAYIAPTVEKLHQMLGLDKQSDGETRGNDAERLASETAAATAASGWVVTVGEVQRDAGSGSFVNVAFRLPDGRIESRQVRFSGADQSARDRLVTELLDHLRRTLR